MADQEQYYENGEGYNQESMDVGGANGNSGAVINASKNDDDERKIFVGGLSWETTVKDMKDYFGKFGDVADATLKTDPTSGRSRGFGFVMFSSSDSVKKVLEEKSHMLHGRNIDPKRAKARGGREPVLKVFVGGIDPAIPEEEIKAHFSQFGAVTDIDLPFDKQKNQRRAFCFVTFESEAVVDEVCKNPKQTIGIKEVDIKKATPKQDQFGGRGGRGGGRGGYGGYGGYDYSQGYGGYGYGYGDYSQGYGGYGGGGYDYSQGYGGYDYSQGYGGGYDYSQGYGGGYGGGYDNNSWGGYGGDGSYGGGQQGSGYGKQKTGGRGGGQSSGSASGSGGSYHPYSR